MLTYSFSTKSAQPLYGQLYSFIRDDILSGRLGERARLPSKRALSSQLGVSVITVAAAYDQLVAEGYIQAKPRQGYFVCRIAKTAAYRRQDAPPPVPVTRAGWFADFASNRVPPEDFPFTIWSRLLRRVMGDRASELMTRPPGEGVPALREAIAGHLASFRGMDVDPEEIIVGAGSEYLYGLLVNLLGRERAFAVENPGYDKVRRVYESNGATCLPVGIDEGGIRMDALRASGADVLHISPSHHFPTGVITPISRRYELLGWANEKGGRFIIEDDYDSEFRLSGRPIPTLFSIDASGRVIYMNTFTKSLSPTIRVSYMVLPIKLLARFRDVLGFYSSPVSNFEQYALSSFISEGFFEKHINRMRTKYKKRRLTLLEAIEKSPLSRRVKIFEEGSGLHFLIKFDTNLKDADLIRRFNDEGLNLRELSTYYHGAAPRTAEHTFLMNYSSLSQEAIEESLIRLERCLFMRVKT